VRAVLDRGTAIPAHPLALTSERRLDERRQRALTRYYVAAGAGGLALAVHTTQFGIRDPKLGLLEPVLALGREEMDRADARGGEPLVRIGGICGETRQAVAEAALLRRLGYHAGLLSLAALRHASEDQLIAHCQAVAEVVPLVGFYLQPAVGGRVLGVSFWRRFAAIESVVAIKIAPFDRYRTLDVVRAVAESGRQDIALYTGNDDAIVTDLLTPYRFDAGGRRVERRIVGGILGHWSVWTRTAVELLRECHAVVEREERIPRELLRAAVEVTDSNAAFFDAANAFAGCIAGLHEVLRRQGLLQGTWCLDPREGLSPGQSQEIERVYRSYPHLNDDAFVRQHLEEWMS
jgi:dihydrodipicolinate synthase/N-acetylneuraminate lyase